MKNVLRTRLTIGADNRTHRLSASYVRRIHRWGTLYLQNYTVVRGEGCYVGGREKSLMLEYTGRRIPTGLIRALKVSLKQNAIVVETYRVRSKLV